MDTQTAKGAVKQVLDRYHISREYTTPYFSDANTKEELYRCQIDNTIPYRSKVFDPKSFSAIEKIVPRMVANRPKGEFRPREAGDIASTKILNELFSYDWDRADMFHKLVILVKTAMVFGTSYARLPWRYERREVRYSEPIVEFKSIQFGSTEKKKMKIIHNGPFFENVNFYDAFPDPQATNFKDARWFIYITYPTIDDLKTFNDVADDKMQFKNLAELARLVKEGNGSTDDTYRTKSREIAGATDYTLKDKTVDNFKMATMYEGDRWVSMALDYNLELRDSANPYYHGQIPFVKLVDYPLANEWFGLGEIEPIERLQRALNAIINQRLDNVNLILNSGWKVNTSGGVDLTSLVSRPGMIVKTRDMAAVERIDIPDVTGSSFSDTYTFLQSSLIDALGVQDYTIQSRQTTPTGQKTATGMSQMNEEMNARFKLKIQLFEEDVIKQVAEQWLKLRQQFTTRPQSIRITGKDALEFFRNDSQYGNQQVLLGDHYAPKMQGMTGDFSHFIVEPNDICGEYDFVPEAGSTRISDPVVERITFNELIQTLVGLQPMLLQSGLNISWQKVISELFDRYNIKGGAEKYVETINQGGLNGGLIGPGQGQPVQGNGYQAGGGGGSPNGVPALPQGPQVPNRAVGLG